MSKEKITWIEDDGFNEILCVKMIDGRISRQIINRAKQGRFTVTPLAKLVEEKLKIEKELDEYEKNINRLANRLKGDK